MAVGALLDSDPAHIDLASIRHKHGVSGDLSGEGGALALGAGQGFGLDGSDAAFSSMTEICC
jgi:hypothetical protein